MIRCVTVAALVSGLVTVCGASGQTLDPAFAGVYTLQDLGTVVGVPINYGGMAFQRGNSDVLLMGGEANLPTGRIYAVPVVRGMDGHITGFGEPVDFADGAYNDGGLDFAPNGTLFVSRYPLNEIGQVRPGNSGAFDVLSPLFPSGVGGTTGGLLFVPPGQPGEGRLKVSSYSAGRWYDVPYSVGMDGLYTFGTVTSDIFINGGPEGFVYVPGCSQAFPNPAILMCEYGFGIVATYDVNENGDPNPASRRVFVSGLSGAEGAVIDPVTGDFLFGTYGGGNRIVRVIGFPPPLNCACDWNNVNCVNSQDFFDFLSDFFANNADFNDDGVTNSQDFFDFLGCFFTGCI